MGSYTATRYDCDNCGKKLPTSGNRVVIQTEKSEGPIGWSRLQVTIEHHHGSHNDGETEKADLCKKCTVALLEDALKRVKKGERMSEGVETSRMLGFNEPF